jgi:hypothetical protein
VVGKTQSEHFCTKDAFQLLFPPSPCKHSLLGFTPEPKHPEQIMPSATFLPFFHSAMPRTLHRITSFLELWEFPAYLTSELPKIALFQFQWLFPQTSLSQKATSEFGIIRILRVQRQWTQMRVNHQMSLGLVLVLQILPLKKRTNYKVMSVRWSSVTLFSCWIKQPGSPHVSGLPVINVFVVWVSLSKGFHYLQLKAPQMIQHNGWHEQ